MELFGFEFKKKQKKVEEKQQEEQKSFIEPVEEGAITIGDNINTALAYNFDAAFTNEKELVEEYRTMALDVEVEWAIDEIINQALVFEPGKEAVSINLDEVEDISENIKKKIIEEFKDGVLKLLDFSNKGDEIFRTWYIDGKIVYHKIVGEKSKQKQGIKEVRIVPPEHIQKIKETEKTVGPNGVELFHVKDEYYVYTTKMGTAPKPGQNNTDAIKIAPEAISFVTSGLYDKKTNLALSYLHKAIKPFNQLNMLESSTVIYRMTRAPERRVFYVDVGNLPKSKAEQYLRNIMTNYKNKTVYDNKKGQIKDQRHHMSMLEDIWLPRREGSRGTEVDTLQGGQNLGELDDVVYFLKKLYKALHIPLTRMETESAFTLGRSSEITRDEVKFDKFIEKLRKKFSFLFIDLLKTQLILKNVITEDDWVKIKDEISFDFNHDSYFAELKDSEILASRLEQLDTVDTYIGRYFSINWVRKHILRQTDEEIEEMDKEIEEEQNEGDLPDDYMPNGLEDGGMEAEPMEVDDEEPEGEEPEAPVPDEPEEGEDENQDKDVA